MPHHPLVNLLEEQGIAARGIARQGHHPGVLFVPEDPQPRRQAHLVVGLRRTQEPHGGWPGRWGVNYIYGTWQVLQGLAKIGVPADDPMVRRAADWLRSVQQPGGCWGESCASYDDPALAGQGTPTASQTAWALLALLAAGRRSSGVERGVAWLVATQTADGTWDEPQFTGTGFPGDFFINYHLYRLVFPISALGRYVRRDAAVTP